MSVGRLGRKMLGKRLLPIAARYYRRIFVDLDKVADSLCAYIPEHTQVLDIGGGDGELLNRILARRPNVSFTMIDISTNLGAALLEHHRSKVQCLPGVSIRQYLDHHMGKTSAHPQCVLISDVLHHVPVQVRTSFLSDLQELFRNTRATMLFKDFEPGYFRSWLGYLSDRFVSGDRQVAFLSRSELRTFIRKAFGNVDISETMLFLVDKPNYLIVVAPPVSGEA